MDLDEVLPDVGQFGAYQQLLLWFVLLPCVLPCGFHAYNQLFMAARPQHWCRVPELDHLDPFLARNLSIPVEWKDGEPTFSHCTMFARNYSELRQLPVSQHALAAANVTTCRHGWTFDYSQYATTVVTEWDMVCQKDFYSTLALVLLGVGGLIGNYIFGYLQDSIGRRPSFFIYLFIECLFGIATAFAQDFVTWTLFRVGVGFTVPAILGTPYVLAIELVGPKHRTVCTILTNIAYSLGLVALAAVVYLIRDWRQLALATSVPFLSFFLYWWVLPESPRWLLARGRFEEAEKILKKMARVNGKSLPANYMVQLKRKYQVDRYMQQKDQEKDHIRSYGVMDLLRTSNLRRKTLIITFIWFTNTSVYVGLSYYAPALGGDEFLNFFLAGAVELPTYVVLWPAMDCAGRRWTLCVSMVIGGLACLGTIMAQNSTTWTLVLYCVGKMGISSSYVVLPLMASELYPTVVRGLGMSFSGVAGMLGPVFIPLVNYMGADMLVLPLLVMGALLVTGGLFSLLLPETLHQHLPQTLEDGEAFGKDWFSCCPTSYRVSDVSKNEKLPVQIVPESPIKSLLTAVTRETPLSTPVVTDGTSSTDVTSDTVLSVGREQTVRVTVV
ncbi:beta-alanine transporter-like isoform X1 [Homalodisca vitripennis]|uniref:beta-alanine transporter-like isoform X1 n=1 Tax=Homalodisca vitripennis TaxID=197043 RepID=UPI001EEB590E|nr:beta-alanine transporter-like isoform X1 [Homalodisca vitripennis]